MEPGKSSYEVDLDTLSISDNQLQVQLVNTEQENGVRFTLKLTPLKDDTLRLQVKESKPLRERFVPQIVLVSELETSKRLVITFLLICFFTSFSTVTLLCFQVFFVI